MAFYNPFSWGDESDSTRQKRSDINAQAGAASRFADTAETSYGQLGADGANARRYLQEQAMGKNSVSAEQLRQGLQQQQAQMQSMAAGAPASSAPMAARTAMIQAGRAGSAMSGQAALAGMQERQAAQKAWMDAILAQRQQDLMAAQGSRQTAISGYGGAPTEGSFLDKWGNAIAAGASVAAKCDRLLKTDIVDAGPDVDAMLDALRPYEWVYTDPAADGDGIHTGVMAQDLQKSPTGSRLVLEGENGLTVDLKRGFMALMAAVARLNERVRELEAGPLEVTENTEGKA